MNKERKMTWLKKRVEPVMIADTDDYVLVSLAKENMYYIINKITKHIETEEPKLPTALYQIDAMQNALTKYRDEEAE
jgi:hypothetical protein